MIIYNFKQGLVMDMHKIKSEFQGTKLRIMNEHYILNLN